jgi:tetratricopeptide (TPR) repeat protein
VKRALVLALSLGCLHALACGGGNSTGPGRRAAVVDLPPANPEAVAKMVQGVAAAKDASDAKDARAADARARAVKLFEEAVALDGNLWEARYNLGVLLAASGDLAGAEEQLAKAGKVATDATEVAVALGEVRRRRGEHKRAADGLGKFLEANPNATEARTLYVATLRQSGQVDKAIAEAREVLVRKPADATGLAELALCHLAKGEQDLALLLVRQALEADAKSAIAHRAHGLVQLARGDDAAAFAAFAKASQEDPRDTTARLNMGTVLLRAGAYAKAEEQYRAILRTTPDDTEATVGLAAALRGQGESARPAKYEEARALLEKVLERDPHHVSALFNLGVLHADFLKRPADAKPLFARFLDDAPSEHPARPDAERYLQMVSAATAASAKTPAPPPARAAGAGGGS